MIVYLIFSYKTIHQTVKRFLDALCFDVRDLTKDMLFENSEVLPPSKDGICSLRADEDEYYFESYGHFSIHEEMLKVGKTN